MLNSKLTTMVGHYLFSFIVLAMILITTTVFAKEAKISLKGEGIKIKQGDASVQVKARIMWDYDTFTDVHHDGQSGNDLELRQARLTLESQLNKAWQTKLQIDFDEDNENSIQTDLADTYLQYLGWHHLELTLGRAKEPFGLERLNSSQYLTTIERSMATNAFAPGRHVGVGLLGYTDQMTWAVGFYEVDEEKEDHNHYALTSRFVYTPWHKHHNLLHLGIAGSIRDFGGEKYQIKERAEVHTADKIINSAKTAADQVHLLGLEAAWIKGPFSLQAEYMMANINAEVAANAHYNGYYIQGSYFLTGESRSYKQGRLGKIKPNSKLGTWELVARYSTLDAQDNDVGVEATNVTFGINYYLNEQIRFMLNYINTELTQESSDESGDALSLRLQYTF